MKLYFLSRSTEFSNKNYNIQQTKPPMNNFFRKKDENTTKNKNEEQSVQSCLKCKIQPIEYETDPCGHPSFCSTCAMKVCTGGKCKTCDQFYGGVRRVR